MKLRSVSTQSRTSGVPKSFQDLVPVVSQSCSGGMWGNTEVAVATRRLRCAGLNRHEAEEEEASRERTSDPLGPEFCVVHREVHGEA